nr:MAG TPA: hypothetical protein [Bacteriophage sp.]
MCKILTQDKSRLIDVSNTDIFIEKTCGKKNVDISIYRFNRSVVLGTYRTKEYAKKILEMIAICLGNNNYYRMPEIDKKAE